ncbi:MAG: hypothetical protein HOA06_10060 [Chloroflexi bacterium]|nr:hypothetical protein [Chloroflexota bacterium]MBT7538636.1 hypothetical protein [Gammaproteobacteria bacterium]
MSINTRLEGTGVPHVELRFEGIRYAVNEMMTQQQLVQDEDFIKAVNAALEPENIRRLVHTQVQSAVRQLLTEEIANTFKVSQVSEIARGMITDQVVAALKGMR